MYYINLLEGKEENSWVPEIQVKYGKSCKVSIFSLGSCGLC